MRRENGSAILVSPANQLPLSADRLGIRSVCPRDSGGTWVHGELGVHQYLALVFPDHPVEPHFELDKTRISKLWIRQITNDQTVLHFERGWAVHPVTFGATHLLFLLAHHLADVLFPREESANRD